MMRTRNLQRGLRVLTLVLLLASGGIVITAWSLPAVRFNTEPELLEAPSAIDERLTDQLLPDLEELSRLAKRDLRRALYDPPPPPPPPEPAPPPPLPPPNVRLVGTIINRENPRALVVDGRGAFEFIGVGGRIGEDGGAPVILSIEPALIRVEHAGREHEIRLADDGGTR